MTERNGTGAGLWALLWLVLFAGIPAVVAWHDSHSHSPAAIAARSSFARHSMPPPMVDPGKIVAVDPDQARTINAAIPFSRLPNPAARPFTFSGAAADLDRATDCLAAAEYYEAGDDATGQRAVAQVVLNRLHHPAFPKTVCGVVFQGSERSTGCQFTFSCDGALVRTPSEAAWDRARTLARQALSGSVYRQVGYATHYHTDWVVPYWSSSLDKITAVGTHLFYRWAGWWGTPPAFRRAVDNVEPVIASIARLSPAHATGVADATFTPPPAIGPNAIAMIAAAPALKIGADMLGKTIGGAKLIAADPSLTSFIVALDRATPPDNYPAAARALCAGRQRCRVLGWLGGEDVPREFPLSGDQMLSMRFSYIHDAPSGLQRILWNCTQTPRSTPGECMRGRTPIMVLPMQQATPPASLPPLLDGVRRKRIEQVTIAPPPAVSTVTNATAAKP